MPEVRGPGHAAAMTDGRFAHRAGISALRIRPDHCLRVAGSGSSPVAPPDHFRRSDIDEEVPVSVPSGYTYDAEPATSPVTRERLGELMTDVMWSEEDAAALRQAGEILEPQVADILDVWYDFIGSTPHLVATFHGPDDQPDQDYLAAVRGRFEQWVVDLCTRDFDQRWLDYQEEIALRHHTTSKNRTDGVSSPADHVPMSDMLALCVPVTLTIRDFLDESGRPPVEIDAMQRAWFKAVTVSLVLWTRPYAAELW